MCAPSVHFSGHATIARQQVLRAMAFDMPAAQWTCLLGASGVGKTTILRLLAGLGDAIDFDGIISASDGQAVAPRVTFMAQDDLLLPWASAYDNVALGARLRGQAIDKEKVLHLLDAVDLGGQAQKKRHELSGGQRQRVALARSLMEDKPIILLDEPFSALDVRTRADMQDLAHGLLRGKTVLLVTHEPSEAVRLADHLLIMPTSNCAAVSLGVPPSPPPRRIDAPESLQTQADLLNRLRRAGP